MPISAAISMDPNHQSLTNLVAKGHRILFIALVNRFS